MRKLKAFFLENFEISLVIIVFIGVLAIAFLVHYKLSFLNFFFLPVILSGYFLGKRQAVLMSIFCVLLVVFYLVFSNIFSGQKINIPFDDMISLGTWASFLILTGGIIGTISEQRESKLHLLREAYIGVLEIVLKYLEVVDEEKPQSVRVANLAGRIAHAAGLKPREVENIKSAALLAEAGDLRSSLHLFEDVTNYVDLEIDVSKSAMGDQKKVMLKTAASLLMEIEPILSNFYKHYVEEVDDIEKELSEIPVGSSIIALADIYDRISNHAPPFQGKEEFGSLLEIDKLGGRTFPISVITALHESLAQEGAGQSFS